MAQSTCNFGVFTTFSFKWMLVGLYGSERKNTQSFDLYGLFKMLIQRRNCFDKRLGEIEKK
jgi:hypothetical protein